MSTNDYLPMYLDETGEFLESLGHLLLALEKNLNSMDSLNEIFRIVHTIKGSAAVIELVDVSNAAHQMENLLSAWRQNSSKVSKHGIDILFECLDALKAYHQHLATTGQPPENLNVPRESLNRLVEESGTELFVSAPGLLNVSKESNCNTDIVRIIYKFVSDVQLLDLKARLILAKLQSAGEIISTRPTEEELFSGKEFEVFFVDLASDLPVESLAKLVQLDGIQSCTVEKKPFGELEEHQISSLPASQHSSIIASPSPLQLDKDKKLNTDISLGVSNASSDTLRVTVAKLDELMNLAGELVIQKSRLAGLVDSFQEFFSSSTIFKKIESLIYTVEMKNFLVDQSSLLADLLELRQSVQAFKAGSKLLEDLRIVQDHLGRTSSGLQKGILATRMIPIGPMFNRFQRMVRDLAQSTGKSFDFVIIGENVELDKRLIDELTEPLLHLLRNAIDHGLEDASTREQNGKKPKGFLRLSASHNANNVVIQVEDDGRGMDLEMIRNKAVALNLVGAEEAQLLGSKQLLEFLWSPGFSTADKITDISGRGFGLDIVRSRINRISGSIDLNSELGKGTTFQIRLPLTLAIMPILLVRVDGQAVAIPIDSVLEVAQISKKEIYQVQNLRTMELRGKFIPVVNANVVLNWKAIGKDANAENVQEEDAVKVVIVTSNALTAGVVVHDFLGRQEIVIKSLSDNYENIWGVAGASILGDGSVCLVMDTDGFLQAAFSQEGLK